jgi:hypothetical protein
VEIGREPRYARRLARLSKPSTMPVRATELTAPTTTLKSVARVSDEKVSILGGFYMFCRRSLVVDLGESEIYREQNRKLKISDRV